MILDVSVRTITCDGPECDKSISFLQKDNDMMVANTEWLRGLRLVQTLDGRNLCYCSDMCEINAIGNNVHNIPAPKKIIEIPSGSGESGIKAAAAAQAKAEEATRAFKTGQPVTINS